MGWLNENSKNFGEYLTWEYWFNILELLVNRGAILVLIIVLTWLAIKMRRVLISRIFAIAKMERKQKETLESLLLSFTRYVLFIIATLMFLGNLGLNIGPIIAGAGVIGLAVGFGAQTLVKDLITEFSNSNQSELQP